jgi:hypothetical protein
VRGSGVSAAGRLFGLGLHWMGVDLGWSLRITGLGRWVVERDEAERFRALSTLMGENSMEAEKMRMEIIYRGNRVGRAGIQQCTWKMDSIRNEVKGCFGDSCSSWRVGGYGC